MRKKGIIPDFFSFGISPRPRLSQMCFLSGRERNRTADYTYWVDLRG